MTDLAGLPPELQARIQNIVAGASEPTTPHQAAIAPPSERPIAPPVRTPSLMEHTIALRQEVNALSQQVAAIGQVVEAVGGAVGEMYQQLAAPVQGAPQGEDY